VLNVQVQTSKWICEARRPRFLDDLFLIVNDTDILDFDKWLSELFVHPQLDFTFNYNNQCISFLDMNVMINDSKISTSIFKKEMSKHQMLHYESNHPKHLIQSLPFSQGIRIIRICSNEEDKNREMKLLMDKFRARNYPEALIINCMEKLNNIDRKSLLRPKSQLLIANLRIHNPHILTLYEVNPSEFTSQNPSNKIFLVMTFYKSVFNISQIVKQCIMDELKYCKNANLQDIIRKLELCVSFKVTNKLKNCVKL